VSNQKLVRLASALEAAALAKGSSSSCIFSAVHLAKSVLHTPFPRHQPRLDAPHQQVKSRATMPMTRSPSPPRVCAASWRR
jgi:hypothetical protein